MAGSLLMMAIVATTYAGESPSGRDTAAEAQFEPFLREFRRALADDDRATLASLTAFPFQYENAELDAAAFQRVVHELFPPAVRRCLAAVLPIREDDHYVLFCTTYAFYFGRVGGDFRLLEFMADGESLED